MPLSTRVTRASAAVTFAARKAVVRCAEGAGASASARGLAVVAAACAAACATHANATVASNANVLNRCILRDVFAHGPLRC